MASGDIVQFSILSRQPLYVLRGDVLTPLLGVLWPRGKRRVLICSLLSLYPFEPLRM